MEAHLNGDVVDVQEADVVRRDLDAEHDPRRQRDEVAVQGFGDERERARCPQVALDHLQFFFSFLFIKNVNKLPTDNRFPLKISTYLREDRLPICML